MLLDSLLSDATQVKAFQVAPAELEGHLLGHSSILDAAVIGTPDEYSGELPLAFVVLRPEVSASIRHDPRRAAAVRASIFEVRIPGFLTPYCSLGCFSAGVARQQC